MEKCPGIERKPCENLQKELSTRDPRLFESLVGSVILEKSEL